MPREHNISFIAHYTAQVWARERLPWAWRFDTRTGRLFYRALAPLWRLAELAGQASPPQFLIQRHRIIDALVQRIAPAQLVELAGGLSPRALALSHKRGVPCVDVDLPPMVRLKGALLGAEQPPGYRLADLDLLASADYAADLGPVLRRVAPTVVITEGILSYFPLARQRQVFARVAALLRHCGGGTYLAEIHHQEQIDRLGELFRAGLALLARSPRHPMIPGAATGRAMLGEAGFDRVTVHDPRDWQHELGLPPPRRQTGLRVYEASVAPGSRRRWHPAQDPV